MRSNSGNDKSRNNLHDPTLRDRDFGRATGKSHRAMKAPPDQRQGQQDKTPKARQGTR
jgi:hypothetical protein